MSEGSSLDLSMLSEGSENGLELDGAVSGPPQVGVHVGTSGRHEPAPHVPGSQAKKRRRGGEEAGGDAAHGAGGAGASPADSDSGGDHANGAGASGSDADADATADTGAHGGDAAGGEPPQQQQKKKRKKVLSEKKLLRLKQQHERRGIVYISRIPPHMKPAKLKQLLAQYGEVGRVYCAPEDTGARKMRKQKGGNTGGCQAAGRGGELFCCWPLTAGWLLHNG